MFGPFNRVFAVGSKEDWKTVRRFHLIVSFVFIGLGAVIAFHTAVLQVGLEQDMARKLAVHLVLLWVDAAATFAVGAGWGLRTWRDRNEGVILTPRPRSPSQG